MLNCRSFRTLSSLTKRKQFHVHCLHIVSASRYHGFAKPNLLYSSTMQLYSHRKLQSTQFSSSVVQLKGNSRNSDTSIHDDNEIDDDFLHDKKYDELFSETYLLPNQGHRVFVVQPDMKNVPIKSKITTAHLQLNELCALVETLPDWTVADKAIHSLKIVDKRHLFGKGKLSELASYIRQCKGVTAAVIGVDMLNSSQLASLQDLWGVAVYDRYTIVLQIFRTRARTKEAKLQVALAEIPYYRSRLRGMHSGSLDQQKGALNFVGGSGETFLETRQRLLHDRETKIRKELDKLRQQRDMLRKQRRKNQFPVVAVVGYTNAGKTSLIKALTGEKSMQPRDQLFATVDVTLHAGLLPNRLKVLYVDTVGFISDIPTTLVESFAATLEDIAGADVLVHVRDISHPDAVAQKHNVLQTLKDLHLPSSLMDNMIEVCNKVDVLDNSDPRLSDATGLPLSVHRGHGMAELQTRIQAAVSESTGRKTRRFRIPMNGPHLQWLYKEATVEDTRPDGTDSEKLLVHVIMTDAAYAKFQSVFASKTKS